MTPLQNEIDRMTDAREKLRRTANLDMTPDQCRIRLIQNGAGHIMQIPPTPVELFVLKGIPLPEEKPISRFSSFIDSVRTIAHHLDVSPDEILRRLASPYFPSVSEKRTPS